MTPGEPYQRIDIEFALNGEQSYSDDITLFKCEVNADTEIQPPDFSGAFVQGTKGKRFLYLSLVLNYQQHDETFIKRLKIPLYTIPNEYLTDGAILEITVDGRASATVKPMVDWRRVH